MDKIKHYIREFKKKPLSRQFSILFSIVIIFSIQISSIFMLANFLTFIEIIPKLEIPSGYVYINIDIENPDDMTVQMPFSISNYGMAELTEITLYVEVMLNFINKSNNANLTLLIFSKISIVNSISPYMVVNDFFVGDFSDFNISALIYFEENGDEYEPLIFNVNYIFKANYFSNLLKLSISRFNITLY